MKKYLALLISALVLVTMLTVPAMAAGGSAAVTSATAASGETVTLTVSLAGFENAASVGMSISTDLTFLSGTWTKSGLVSSVTATGAVWAVDGPTYVNGDMLTLNFRVPAYDGTKSYPVTVNIEVKNGATTLGKVSATGYVTVSNPTQSIALDKNALALDLSSAKTAALVATLNPANATDTVAWTSSDNTVATVANGTVTALKAGTATITATAGGKSATCAVTVTCTHANAVLTKAAEATCKATGNNAYYTCADCGKVLKADKATETTVQAETLAKVDHKGGTATCTAQAICSMCEEPYGEMKPHSFSNAWQTDANQHWLICTTCSTEKKGLADHSYEWVVDDPATEDKVGVKHEECVCGVKRNENTEIPKLDHVHKGIQKHNAVAATCVKPGTVQYWTCSSAKCDGKYYGDAACQILLNTIEAPIDPDDHAGKGSYESDDDQHWKVCSACEGIMGQKQNHKWSWVVDKPATETATGLKHEVCYTCKAQRSKDTEIEKLKHLPVKVEGKEATCTEEGAQEHFYCGNCDTYYASNNGYQGAAIAKDTVIIPALGHTFAEAWESDDTAHWHICTVCEEASEKEKHTTELVDAVEATKETEGYTGDQICTVCQTVVVKGETVPVVTEPTEPPTEEPTEAPAQTPDQTPAQQPGMDMGLLIALGILLVVIAGVVVFVVTKRK